MLDLRDSARLARERMNTRLRAARGKKSRLTRSAAIVQQGASFRFHLLEALRKNGDERSASNAVLAKLYLAFPEKLLGKWCYLAFGVQREATHHDAGIPAPHAAWQHWYSHGTDSRIANFAGAAPDSVLLAHGLSAIEDSVLLLADIGRAFRASRALSVPLSVLLADVSWMSHNRSLRRFDLTNEQIENGLRRCQERRLRLYKGIGATVKLHAVVPYARKGTISSQKIHEISSFYVALAAALWGEDKVVGTMPLSNGDLAMIGRPPLVPPSASSPLQMLSQHQGAPLAQDGALAKHLNVLRAVAQRFRMLTADTFSYFFTQYYAQDEYRGDVVKIAPLSERNFDEPYDDLDDSFRLWGEGHDPQVARPDALPAEVRRMAAVYLPQYHMGDLELLPYSPLSLSVAARGGPIAGVREKIILLTDNTASHRDKVAGILRMTLTHAGVAQLNRLAYDIVSFIQAVLQACGKSAVESACCALGVSMDQRLATIDPTLAESFTVECEDTADLGALWLSWLDSIEAPRDLQYTPTHILLATMTDENWRDDAINALADVVLVANRLARDLSDPEAPQRLASPALRYEWHADASPAPLSAMLPTPSSPAPTLLAVHWACSDPSVASIRGDQSTRAAVHPRKHVCRETRSSALLVTNCT